MFLVNMKRWCFHEAVNVTTSAEAVFSHSAHMVDLAREGFWALVLLVLVICTGWELVFQL